jgi:GTP pyrophosphokinase
MSEICQPFAASGSENQPYADWLMVQPAGAACPSGLQTALMNALATVNKQAEPRELRHVLSALTDIQVDADVMLAAALHLWPALRAQMFSKPELAPENLRRLLESLDAADTVWGLHAQHEGKSSAEGLRRLLLALVRDLRGVLILLAVQLVRLRHSDWFSADQQKAIATLCMDIHAPLANRLGIWQWKWELEDLSFRNLQPDTYQRIAKLLDEKRSERQSFIEQAKQEISQALSAAGVQADIAGRPKHIYSIWKKMQRKNVPFGELYDVRAVRVLVSDVATCYAALGVVHQLWLPIPTEFDDYIARPKGNDYRSLHTALIGPGGRALEVQIRTHDMHKHAELGVAAHWRYKEGGKNEASFERKVAWMRQLLEAREEGDSLQSQLQNELLEDRVYLLTPKGEVMDLPQGATVLDFAYHVHTSVGHRCRGAKVNGRIVPLNFAPHSGDRVDIMTGKELEPRRDWLQAQQGFLKTGRARDKVRAWFAKVDRERNLKDGKEILEKELRRIGMLNASIEPALQKLRLPGQDDLLIALALGDVGPSQISRALHDAQQSEQTNKVDANVIKKVSRKTKSTFEVQGVGNVLTQIARCCQPVPGDAIIGYLTQGKGVSIHRQSCASVQRLQATHPERCLAVEWGQKVASHYEAGVRIYAVDRKHFLKDITNTLSQENIAILGLRTQVNNRLGTCEIDLNVRIANYEELSRLLGKLAMLPGVEDVRRAG